ncbi:MAG: RNA polymerase sigma factor [Oscillospiraceae bacterium]
MKSTNSEFDEIYRLYAKDVYRFALGLCRNEELAEDIVQDTMLKAVKSIDKFDGRCSLKTYLCTIARNLYLNHVKKAESRNLPLDEAIEVSSGDSVEQKTLDKLQAQQIHKALHQLEEPYKEVFSLHVFAEMKFKDIGALFDKSDNWARVIFFRAKEKIIAIIEKEDNNG